MFNPVSAEEMAFALSIFVSAASGRIFPSGPPDAMRSSRERWECQQFLTLLAPSEGCGPWEEATRQDSQLFVRSSQFGNTIAKTRGDSRWWRASWPSTLLWSAPEEVSWNAGATSIPRARGRFFCIRLSWKRWRQCL